MRVARPPAQLGGGNLLTGQLYVALDFFSDASGEDRPGPDPDRNHDASCSAFGHRPRHW